MNRKDDLQRRRHIKKIKSANCLYMHRRLISVLYSGDCLFSSPGYVLDPKKLAFESFFYQIK